MSAIAPLHTTGEPQPGDAFVHRHGVTWDDYERALEERGDHSAPRISYLEGTLEIMSPSRSHESIKSVIGRLVEVYCLERGIEFSTYGNWTLKERKVEAGAEPDECYVFGRVSEPERPDLAIEVVWTSGELDKLEIYRRLGVREVWYYRRGKLQVHGLRGDRYEALPASEVVSGIDTDEIVTFLGEATTSDAIRKYRAALQAR